MEFRVGDVSDDGYWVFTESGWQATEQQKQALEQGAAPYEPEQPQSDNGVENVQIVTIPSDMSRQFSDSSVWVWRIVAGAICLSLTSQNAGHRMTTRDGRCIRLCNPKT